jgi:hypothetical protein
MVVMDFYNFKVKKIIRKERFNKSIILVAIQQ